ncbi:hypothetical protein VOLCADRAFT_91078 [Volvox carteri f. nagariensis]|uniref:G-patch domain-containing protein n=1 Tax=Volvox carteri f. nagariensis TaxID=3068 RepID=D8TW44_VOLCA|nr:uncharacterized protein VOLCADRAFT_91078 [Volvox carteri f. nagariensis]EFJ48305.1 hypothetical protein VOLCADRAFT_91078 [Volvox carteri f. nagariensis]|eukprot:XP_002950559.1 hypothetical protein VOLCADRAFT_91078 [Volvox carteri f. nagariensis]
MTIESDDELEALLNSYTAEAAEQNRRLEAKASRQHKPRKEKAIREAGLQQPLDSGNKGYALLQKMGFEAGKGLGSTSAGRSDPLPLDIKAGRAGLGVDEQRKRERQERQRQEELDRVKRARLVSEAQNRYQDTARAAYAARLTVRHLWQAWRVAEHLDEQHAAAALKQGRSETLRALLSKLPALAAMMADEAGKDTAGTAGLAAAEAPSHRSLPGRSAVLRQNDDDDDELMSGRMRAEDTGRAGRVADFRGQGQEQEIQGGSAAVALESAAGGGGEAGGGEEGSERQLVRVGPSAATFAASRCSPGSSAVRKIPVDDTEVAEAVGCCGGVGVFQGMQALKSGGGSGGWGALHYYEGRSTKATPLPNKKQYMNGTVLACSETYAVRVPKQEDRKQRQGA